MRRPHARSAHAYLTAHMLALVALLCSQATFVVPARPPWSQKCAGSPQMRVGSSRTFPRAVRSVRPRMSSLSRGLGPGMSGSGGGNGGGMTPGPGSSGDEDGVGAMLRKRYQQLLHKQPLLAKALTSLVGFALGDILAQTCIQNGTPFDWWVRTRSVIAPSAINSPPTTAVARAHKCITHWPGFDCCAYPRLASSCTELLHTGSTGFLTEESRVRARGRCSPKYSLTRCVGLCQLLLPTLYYAARM